MMPELSPLPEFPEFEPPGRDHHTLMSRAFAAMQPQVSELTFAYLYAWNNALNCRLCRFDDAVLVLVYSERDATSYYLPPVTDGDQAAVIQQVLPPSTDMGIADSFARVTTAAVEKLQRSDGLECTNERHRADYVYLATDLQDLPAARYHNKRNLIRQFWSAYPAALFRELDAVLARECILFSRRWLQDHPRGDSPGLRREVDAVCIMLEGHDWLGLKGGAVVLNGQVVAFSVGEAINDRMLAVRAEKADASFRGAYQVINQEFARHVGAGFEYINRESDMGIAGLRRAKLSYHPHHLLEKWRVRLK